MRTRPGEVSDDDVSGVLAEGWRLDATSIDYLPVGFGSHHWGIVAGGRRWFLTLDDLDAKRRSAAEPPASRTVGCAPRWRPLVTSPMPG